MFLSRGGVNVVYEARRRGSGVELNQHVKPLSNGARSLLDQLLKSGGASQAALTAQSDLSQPQVARLVRTFHDEGMVRISERAAQGRGNPSVHVTLNPDFAYGLGVSMEGDALSTTLIDFSGRVRATLTTAMTSMAPSKVVEQLRAMKAQVVMQARIDPARIVGAGVGFSGFFVGDPPRFNPQDRLREWATVDVAEALREPLGLSVLCENDSTAAAIAESLLGVGRSCPTFAYCHLTNGIGGGVIVDGKPIRGHAGNAGDFGGVLWFLDQGYPNLELLRDLVNGAGATYATVEDMLGRIDLRTAGVEQWLETARQPIGSLTFLLGHMLAPERVIIGGKLPRSIAQALADSVRMPRSPVRNASPFPLPSVAVSQVEGDPVAIGAAIMPLAENFFV